MPYEPVLRREGGASMELLYTDDNLVVCVKPLGLDSEHDLPQILAEELNA